MHYATITRRSILLLYYSRITLPIFLFQSIDSPWLIISFLLRIWVKLLYNLGETFIQFGWRFYTIWVKLLYNLGETFIQFGWRFYTIWVKLLYNLGETFIQFRWNFYTIWQHCFLKEKHNLIRTEVVPHNTFYIEKNFAAYFLLL